MIELSMNGRVEWQELRAGEDIPSLLARTLPDGHAICTLWVNGDQIPASALPEIDVTSVRELRVESGDPGQLARDALAETRDWIARISGVCESVSNDYRDGSQQEAMERLALVTDALQVLIHLLAGIRASLELEEGLSSQIDAPWKEAEQQLLQSVDALSRELVQGDPIVLADRVGHDLPRSLEAFRVLIDRVQEGAGPQ